MLTMMNETLLDQRFTSNGVEMRLVVTPSETGFRAEILPMSPANSGLKHHWFRQATAWTRELAASADNTSVHCFRNESGYIIESLGLRFSPAIDIAGLQNLLRSPLSVTDEVPHAAAIGAGALPDGPFLTG